jgi:hypothetical protein
VDVYSVSPTLYLLIQDRVVCSDANVGVVLSVVARAMRSCRWLGNGAVALVLKNVYE